MLNDQVHYGLGYSTTVNFTTNLFAGAAYDSFKISRIYVQVYDDDGAFTVYEIATPILIVLPDMTSFLANMNDLISANPYFSSNVILNQGSYLSSLEEIQTIASLLNHQSFSDKLALNLNDSSTLFFPSIYGPLANYSGVIPVNNLIFL